MHPILFRIPVPAGGVPYSWLVMIAAAIALLLAAYFWFAQHDKASAVGAVAVSAALVGVRLGLKWVLHNVLSVESEALTTPIPIYSYGVMLGLSLVVGWYLTLGLAERDGLPKETMANNYVVTAVAAVAGSRVLYILTNLNEFNSLGDMLAMRKGGLVAYGGFLGGLAGSFFFLRRHKIPLLPWADVAVPSLASGLMITRIGCYLFGCDFGQPLKANAPSFLKKLGTFPHWPEGGETCQTAADCASRVCIELTHKCQGTLEHGSGAPAWKQHYDAGLVSRTSDASLPVHPTQIYESLVGLGLLVLLLWARKKQQFRGQIFFLFAFAYGVCRYMLEILRDDAERGEIPPSLPVHVLVPLGCAILAAGYVIGFSKAIKNITVQRVTQVAAFIPAVALYIALKPETFAASVTRQYSTSQFIALTSGFAACAAFAVFYKAALMHPKQAMALNLPALAPAGAPAGAAGAALPDDEDDDEEARDERPKPAAKKGASDARKSAPDAKKKGAKSKIKAKATPKPKVEDDDGEEERKPADEARDDDEKEAKPDDDAKDEPSKDEVAKDEPAKDDEGVVEGETKDAKAKDKAKADGEPEES